LSKQTIMQYGQAVNPEGLRADGRRVGELRKVYCRLGGLAGDGSAVFQMGNTHVACSVHGPRERRGRVDGTEQKAVVTCEYSMAPFATQDRKQPVRRDRRSMEVGRILANTFAAVIETERFPRSEIHIVVTVLQADGGARGACINAISLAMADAGIPMKDLVASCAAGRVADTILLDPNFREASSGMDLPVALLASSEKIVMCQMDHKLPAEDFGKVLRVAMDGALVIAGIMKAVINDYLVATVNAQQQLAQSAAATKKENEDAE
jgi:exosome complex component RRP41